MEGKRHGFSRENGDLLVGILQGHALHETAERVHHQHHDDPINRGVIMRLDQKRGAPAEIQQARQDVVDGPENCEAEEAVNPEEFVGVAKHREMQQHVHAAHGKNLLRYAGPDEEHHGRIEEWQHDALVVFLIGIAHRGVQTETDQGDRQKDQAAYRQTNRHGRFRERATHQVMHRRPWGDDYPAPKRELRARGIAQ